MSTIKSSDEHLTLNADGSSKDIKFQANGVEKASISSSGAFTSTTIDATKLTGTIPNFTSTGIDDNADATAITIDSSENVGIGTSPSYKLHTLIGAGEASGVGILNTSGQGLNIYTDSTAANADVSIDQGATGAATIFRQDGTERLRLAGSGNVLIGTTNDGGRLEVTDVDNASAPVVGINANSYSSGTVYHIRFRVNDSTKGSVTSDGSSVAYNTSSDYRLKENVDYTWDATTRLKQLKPARFNWIADETDTVVDGFLAHEVQDIVPEAVSGEKDAMTAEVFYAEGDELPEGKSVGDVKTAAAINPQGIDQSKLVPLLVKTIQELEARIAALEA